MSRNKSAYIAVVNDAAQTVAAGADVTFNKSSPESNVEHCDGATGVTIEKKGAYQFDYLVQAANSDPASTAALSFALYADGEILPLTSFATSTGEGTQTVEGKGIVCLDKCQEITLRNAAGGSVELASNGSVINAVLRLVLLDHKSDH